ncbi:MAG: hypothetical protein ACFUZC_16165 [Chthoniobacteraceae bacterium]
MPPRPLLALLLASALLTPLAPASARIVEADSFETPRVAARTPKATGGDPSLAPAPTAEPPFWQCMEDQPAIGCDGGSLVAGLSNEQSRGGTQALYIEARHLCAPFIGVQWATRPLPIRANRYYSVTIWGRSAPGLPGRPPAPPLYLNVRVSFFRDEGGQETGESVYLVIPLQGSAQKGINATNWTPLRVGFEAPGGAKFMTVNYQCDGRASREAINGTVYFDDFSVSEEAPRSGERTLASRANHRRGKGNPHSKRLFACRS